MAVEKDENAGGPPLSPNDRVWRERDVYCRVKRTFYCHPSHPCSLSCGNERTDSASSTLETLTAILCAGDSSDLSNAEPVEVSF